MVRLNYNDQSTGVSYCNALVTMTQAHDILRQAIVTYQVLRSLGEPSLIYTARSIVRDMIKAIRIANH